MSASAVSEKGNGQKLNIGIMGARCNNEIRQLLVDRGANLLFDLTCTGLARDFSVTEDKIYALLSCQRLTPDSPVHKQDKRRQTCRHFLDGFTDRLDGIVFVPSNSVTLILPIMRISASGWICRFCW